MAFSKATLISRIRRVLNDNPWQDVCTEAMDTTETDLSVADTTLWQVGDILEFSDDGEQCLVTALFSATVLTVVRGYATTPGTGTAHNITTTVFKNPHYAIIQIEQAISEVIYDLYPHAYKLVTYSLTPQTDGNHYYELDDGGTNTTVILDISSVWQEVGSGATSKLFSYGTHGRSYPADLLFGLPPNKVGSTVAMYIPFTRDPTNAIIVRGITRILDTFSTPNYTDLDEGLPADTVLYLTCAQLIAEKDVQRTSGEDISMADENLNPGDRTRIAAFWEQKGTMSLRKWQMQLAQTLPRRGAGTKPQGRI
jgi:hypothetical protein